MFGLTLGVVFVPCAGPVLAAITVLAASEDGDAARAALDSLRSDPQRAAASGTRTFDECAADSSVLADCGSAPELTGIVD